MFTRTSSATRQLRTASTRATFTSSGATSAQLLQVLDDSDRAGLQVENRTEAPTSAELVRHEPCNPVAGA